MRAERVVSAAAMEGVMDLSEEKRRGAALIRSTKPYAEEDRALTWRLLLKVSMCRHFLDFRGCEDIDEHR